MTDIFTVDDTLLTILKERGETSASLLFSLMQAKGVEDIDTRSAIWRLQSQGVIRLNGSLIRLVNQ